MGSELLITHTFVSMLILILFFQIVVGSSNDKQFSVVHRVFGVGKCDDVSCWWQSQFVELILRIFGLLVNNLFSDIYIYVMYKL